MRTVLGALLLILPVMLGAAKRPALPELGYPLAEIKPRELRSQFTDKRRGHRHNPST